MKAFFKESYIIFRMVAEETSHGSNLLEWSVGTPTREAVAEEISQRSNLLEWSVRTPTREAVSIHYLYTIHTLSMLYLCFIPGLA